MTTTLVIRLSSLGDVAITIPVLYSVANRYPDDYFILITKSSWQQLFIEKPSNLTIFPVNSKDKHKGIKGIFKLLHELSLLIKTKEIKVADLHGVIRSFLIDFYYRIKGKQVAVINKGRGEKRKLVRQKNKIMRPLKTTVDRYRDVFEKLGYDSTINFKGFFSKKPADEQFRVGIAPFAKHEGKTYSLTQMEEVVSHLNKLSDVEIVLFGSKEESYLLESWEKKYTNTRLVAGKMSMHEELILMNQMNLMVSMDSANMHLASLVNTPVVSIWGATHSYAGFYGYNQNESNIMQLDLPCRPCSIYGNKPCQRGDYACLKEITPEMIIEKIFYFVTHKIDWVNTLTKLGFDQA